MANQFLIKDTMSDMRAISTSEINDLQANIYEGVLLLGYYAKGDTPTPIIYYLSGTLEADDGGSVVEVEGAKLEHKFVGQVDVRYFGIVGSDTFISIDSTPDITERLQKVEDYRLENNLQLIWNTTGFMRISSTIRLGSRINWINPIIGERENPNFKIFVTTSILFRRKDGLSSPNLFGIFRGICFEYFSTSSINTEIGKQERINSVVFFDFSFYSIDFSWNWFRHFGTIVYGGLSNLSHIYQNRVRNVWFAFMSNYLPGETDYTSTDFRITDSRIFNNFITGETSVDRTAFVKGHAWGHMSIYGNFFDFFESIFDNSVVDLSLYCTGSKLYGNTIDYCINLSKGNFSFMTIDDNHIMNMSVRSATIISPQVNWGLYGTNRIKNMEWGLFKDAGRLSYILFVNNRIEHLDFIIKSSSPFIFSGLKVHNNGWYKSTNNNRESNSIYSLKELKAKVKIPSANLTIYQMGQQNDLSDIGFITDRITPLLGISQKGSNIIDTCTQLGVYNSKQTDDIRGVSIIEDSTAQLLKISTSGKAVFIDAKRDSKLLGAKFAYEIADDFINNRLYEGDIVNCSELGGLTYTSIGGIADSNGVKRIITSTELISYTGTANVLAYVYDVGAFVQLFSSVSKPWRGNNVLSSSQITNISSSINTFGTILPTTNLIPDRPFILLSSEGNIITLYKVNSNYEWVVYDSETKIRYDELLRDYGTTTLRPKFFVKNGFTYYNTDISKLQIFKSGIWSDVLNTAAPSADSAVNVGGSYSQTEVQAILDELRDLKAKLRAAGILAN